MLGLLATYAKADDLRWACFVSENEAKPIRLAFAFGSGSTPGAFVRYKNGNGRIALEQKSFQSVEMAEGRPFENTYEYVEKSGGTEGGKYTVVVQGAIFYEFSYQSKKRAKPYKFVMDAASDGGPGCKW